MTEKKSPPNQKPADVMTLSEMAKYLKLSEKTITRMVQSGKIPGAKVASQWRFVRAAIDDWLNARIYSLPKKNLLQVVSAGDKVLPIEELISPERILLNIKPGSKESVLLQLVEPLRANDMVDNPDEFLNRLIKRENLISTAIGHGLAVPHVRVPEKTIIKQPGILIGICSEGTDFDSFDGRKTYVFAVPCVDSESGHLRMMAHITLMFRQSGILKKIRNAETREDVFKILSGNREENKD